MKNCNLNLINSMETTGYVFNPLILYEGAFYLFLENAANVLEYNLKTDAFVLNANKKAGKNMYLDYLDKYFYNKILPLNFDISRNYFLPILLSKDGKDNIRTIKFSFIPTLFKILSSIGIDVDFDFLPTEEENLIDYVVNVLRSKRSIIYDVIQNGSNSPYYEKWESVYRNDFNNIKLQEQYDIFTELIIVVKGMKKHLNNNFNIEKFKECFDLEKLYLLLAKMLVEESLACEKDTQRLNNSFIEVLQYIKTVEDNCDENYNPEINYYDVNTQIIEKYGYKDLKREVAHILVNHPEFKYVPVSYEDAAKHNLFNNIDAAKTYVEEAINKEILLANWEFIRKGSLPATDDKINNYGVGVEGSIVLPKQKDEYESLLEKINLFESTNYEYRIIGKNKFEGYIGYIYHNGIVVFEKMYEDKERRIPSKGNNATYIMTLDNFVQFSNMTKIQIIDYIKNTNNPNVWRLYHNKTMKERLYKFINGVYYSKNVEDVIDKMLSEEIITKKLEN